MLLAEKGGVCKMFETLHLYSYQYLPRWQHHQRLSPSLYSSITLTASTWRRHWAGVSGDIAESLLFLLVRVNSSKQWQILKRRGQRRRSRGWSVQPVEAGNGWINNSGCEFTTWMNKCTFDNFESQRASSPYTAIKNGKSNCRKLRSERTNQSLRPASTWRVVNIFWRCTSGYSVGVHVDVKMTEKHKRPFRGTHITLCRASRQIRD